MTESARTPGLLTVSPRLRIRRFRPGDTEDFVGFMVDPESTRFLAFDDEQKSRDGATALLHETIAAYDSDSPMMAFAAEDRRDGHFVGFCGLTPHEEGAVEIMYAVMPRERAQGYAVEMAAALARHAVHKLGYARVVAPISARHTVSIAVAEKAGFECRSDTQSPRSTEGVRLFVFEQPRA